MEFLLMSLTLIGIIEIKCPYSVGKLTVQEACIHCSGFYCYLNDDGEVKLNRHYFQVLGTIAITKAQFCNFIIWMPKLTEIFKHQVQRRGVAMHYSSTRKLLHEICYHKSCT